MKRRTFFKDILGGAAVSFAYVDSINAEIYNNIKSLNEKLLNAQSPDGVYWDTLKNHYLLEDDLILMNNGSIGPMPETVFNTLMQYFKVQATNPDEEYNFLPLKIKDTKNKLAEFINAAPNEVAITRNTTEGMNFAAHGLSLRAGDEVLITNVEHFSGIAPWQLREKTDGIKIQEVALPLVPESVEEVVDCFKQAITSRTKVFSISHPSYINGLLLPLKEISDLAHKKGIYVIADGAHAVGMLDLDVKELGIDVYTSSPYKWLGAPPGTGVFYIRREVQDSFMPMIVDRSKWAEYKDAGKFELLGKRPTPLTAALDEAINFNIEIGKKRIERRIKALAMHLKTQLKSIPGVKLHTSMDPYLSAGLTVFSIKDIDPQRIVDYLREKYNIVVRTIGDKGKGTYGVRVSTHIFVSERDVDTLIEGTRFLAKQG